MNIILGVISIFITFSLVVLIEKIFKKEGLYVWVGISTIIANILVCKSIDFLGFTTSLGNVMFASNFLATDIMCEKYGATSNSISPGGVITKLNEHILNDESLYKQVLDETLLNKWATPEEIAEFVYFVSVINKSMTGEDIFIDNGEKLKSNFIW